jgi:hypothetical protein
MNNRDRHSHRHGGNGSWKNGGRDDNRQNSNQHDAPRGTSHEASHAPSKNAVPLEQIKAEEAAISAFKTSNQKICEICGKPIIDLSSAIGNRGNDNPVHFDCVLELLQKEEHLEPGDKISYIGQGRFGVINYPNVHDVKHFVIKKVIDWESKESHSAWREEISNLFSQVR